jgi:SSS family solute:Na+ symporter
VQRALAANSMGAARRTPIVGAIPKMLFPAIVILPGMIAYALTMDGPGSGYSIPVKLDANRVAMLDSVGKTIMNYNQVLPSMILNYFPNGLLGLALTALMASFMSGMAANVTAFNTVWTYDLYSQMTGGKKTDKQLLSMGKVATIAGIILAMGCALIAAKYNNIMAILQLVFGFVNAPLFATFLLGMFTKRSNNAGAFWGLLIGTGTAVVFHGLSWVTGNGPGVKGAWISQVFEYPKDLSQSFMVAIVAFSVTFVINAGLSFTSGRNKTDEELAGLVYSLTPKQLSGHEAWILRPAVLGIIVMIAAIALNIIFW